MFPLLAILFCLAFWTFLFVASRRTKAADSARRDALAALLQRELGAVPDREFSEDSYDIRRGSQLVSFSLEPGATKVQLEFGRADGTTPLDDIEDRDEDDWTPAPGARWDVEDGTALVLDAETTQDGELVAIFTPHVERLGRAGITYLGCYFEMLECDVEAESEAELVGRIRQLLDPLARLYDQMDARYVAFAEAERARLAA